MDLDNRRIITETLNLPEQQGREAFKQRKSIQLSDFVVGEINRIKLVQSRTQIFDHRNFVTFKN